MATVQSLIAAVLLCIGGCSKPAPVIVSEPKPIARHIEQPVPAPVPVPASTPEEPLVMLPGAPEIVPAARDLIIEFEGFDHRPAWPEGNSGVTVAAGYDCGYYASSIIKSDWHEIVEDWRNRLAWVSGITGARAHAKISGLHDIYIETEVGDRVFDSVDVPREYNNCKKFMPGCEDLRPNAQGALISLGYNRGWSTTGNSRTEMRAIRSLVPSKDYSGMATQLRKMKRVWAGTSIQNGMYRRREAEAKLMETP